MGGKGGEGGWRGLEERGEGGSVLRTFVFEQYNQNMCPTKLKKRQEGQRFEDPLGFFRKYYQLLIPS